VLAGTLIAPATASADPADYCEASAFRNVRIAGQPTQEPVVANRPPVRPCEDATDDLAGLSLPPNTTPPNFSLTLLQAHTNDFPRRDTIITPESDRPDRPEDEGQHGAGQARGR
jgi:hypothetical protein